MNQLRASKPSGPLISPVSCLARHKSLGRSQAITLDHQHRAGREVEHALGELVEGDVALSELLDTHPDADRQRLRQLVRNCAEERARNKPPHAFRELFREVRQLTDAEAMQDDEAQDPVTPESHLP